MLKKLLPLVALLLLCGLGMNVIAQEKSSPFTKEEILQYLKPAPGKRVEQGDLAAEIDARGIAFQVDDKTLTTFRQAGARSFVIDAIRQAAEDAKRPKLIIPPSDNNQQTTSDSNAINPAADNKPLTLLDKARQHSLEFLDELPNFVVTQFVSRYVRMPEHKDWKAEDQLEVELTYRVNKGEHFKLLKLNGKTTSMSYENLGGATSTGEFGSMLAALFSPQSQANFKEIRKEKFNGRDTVLYEYAVKKANSSHQITDKSSNRTVVTAYQGSIWVEIESGRVLRIEQSAEDIQRGFPITLAESAVEYDWVTIAGAKYLMPISAEVILGSDANRYYSRNVIELKNYRVFDTDVKMILEKEPPQ